MEIREYFNSWKAFEEYKRRKGVHWGWDLVFDAFLLAFFMWLGNIWIGVATSVVSTTIGIMLNIYSGNLLRVCGSDRKYEEILNGRK